jgi:hypothetical protein
VQVEAGGLVSLERNRERVRCTSKRRREFRGAISSLEPGNC